MRKTIIKSSVEELPGVGEVRKKTIEIFWIFRANKKSK